MLLVDYEEQEGITVPYPPIFDDIRNNHGFVDLRGHPDLAKKIVEGLKSNALQNILVALAHAEAPFFTLGCDLGTHEDDESDPNNPYVAGGYLQIMDRDYSERVPNDYLTLAYAIADALEKDSAPYNWIIHFLSTSVMFKLDDYENIAPSLWIWLYAAAPSPNLALESREALIERLQATLLEIRA